MEVSYFKVFFSKRKEAIWLNELGEKGYLLKHISDSKYTFEYFEDQKYYYSVEHLDFSPRSERAEEYYKDRLELELKPIITDNNWVYFVRENKPLEYDENVNRNSASYHFWKMIYTVFFSFCGSVLCGYHFYAIGFLERIGQAGDGKISSYLSPTRSTSAFHAALNIVKRVANYMLDALNGYFKLWTYFLGENDAVAVISIVLPITVILLIISAFHMYEYLSYIKKPEEISLNNVEELINEDAE